MVFATYVQLTPGVPPTKQCTAVVTLLAALARATSKPAFHFAGHETFFKLLLFAKHQTKEQDLLWWHTGMLSISPEVCKIFATKGCLLDLRFRGPATSDFHEYKIINYYSYNIITFQQVCSQELRTNASEFSW